MMEDFRLQAERMGTDIRFGYVSKADFTGPVHKLVLDTGEEILSPYSHHCNRGFCKMARTSL
jgi:thioredoxin reductase (NADPH)